jgi:hypothetical protein
MTHTQGPWNLSRLATPDYRPEFGIYTDGSTDFVRVVGNNSEENAALIAASPDLLDALLIALPFVEDLETDEGYKAGAVKKAVDTIRAAILKATGE